MNQKRIRGVVLIAVMLLFAASSAVYAKGSCGSAKAIRGAILFFCLFFVVVYPSVASSSPSYAYSECYVEAVITGYHQVTGDPLYSCYENDSQYFYDPATCIVSLNNTVRGYCGGGGTHPENCLYACYAPGGIHLLQKWICWGSKPNGVDNDGDLHYGVSQYCPSSIDCNDNDSAIYLGAPELCDDKDNNCNGATDEGCASRPPGNLGADGLFCQ